MLLLQNLEELVSELGAKVMENFKSLSNQDGNLNNNNMWNVKRKVFPKNKESLPIAKKDSDGKFVSSHKQLKDLYLNTFVHRLRQRPVLDVFDRSRWQMPFTLFRFFRIHARKTGRSRRPRIIWRPVCKKQGRSRLWMPSALFDPCQSKCS